jgi:hypothetical protein
MLLIFDGNIDFVGLAVYIPRPWSVTVLDAAENSNPSICWTLAGWTIKHKKFKNVFGANWSLNIQNERKHPQTSAKSRKDYS